jgi:hypothetical protein
MYFYVHCATVLEKQHFHSTIHLVTAPSRFFYKTYFSGRYPGLRAIWLNLPRMIAFTNQTSGNFNVFSITVAGAALELNNLPDHP